MIELKLNKNETLKAENFKKLHKHNDVNKGAIGGHITYSFTPTSIGTAVTVECNICGKKENITDYDSW